VPQPLLKVAILNSLPKVLEYLAPTVNQGPVDRQMGDRCHNKKHPNKNGHLTQLSSRTAGLNCNCSR